LKKIRILTSLITNGDYIPSGYVKIAIENGPVEIVDLPSYKMVDLSIVMETFTRGCIYCIYTYDPALPVPTQRVRVHSSRGRDDPRPLLWVGVAMSVPRYSRIHHMQVKR